MKSAVAARVKQYAVAHIAATAVDPPDDLVAAPASHPGDGIVAFRASSSLANPEAEQLLSFPRIGLHLHIKPTLKVRLPSRVVRVGLPFYLDMSYDAE